MSASEYDELLARLEGIDRVLSAEGVFGDYPQVLQSAAAAIRALTAQVVELTAERKSVLSASEQGEAGGIIKNAREDAAGWAEAASGLQGRKYFAYSGVARMLLEVAGVAERAIVRAHAAEAQVVERDAVIEQQAGQIDVLAEDHADVSKRLVWNLERVETWKSQAEHAEQEIASLRTVIESAPHSYECEHKNDTWMPGDGPIEDSCICWKSQAPRDALAARDAVRENVRAWMQSTPATQLDNPRWLELDAIVNQSLPDALAARDAVRDKTVRATALRDAADGLDEIPGGRSEHVPWLRDRADQEEGKS